jgi:hypothetical protein
MRIDNFEYPDHGWDLKAGDFEIEVKSSQEKKFDIQPQEIYDKRRLIINENNMHSHFSDAYVQVFFTQKTPGFFGNENLDLSFLIKHLQQINM